MHSIYLKAPLNFFLKGLPTNVTEQIMVGNQFFGSAAQSAEHAYMYGTRLKMLANDQVIFENHFLPTGSVIYRWDELYGYITAKATPQLPLLIHSHHYQLHLVAHSNYPNGVYLRVTMYDYQGKLVQQQIIRSAEGIFTFVPKAYTYSIELVSAGCTRLEFHRLDITDVTTDLAATALEPTRDEDDPDVVVDEKLRVPVSYEQLAAQNKYEYQRQLAVVNQYLE